MNRNLRRTALEKRARAHAANRPFARMVDRFEQADRLQVRMLRQLVDRINSGRRNVEPFAQRQAFVGTHLAGHAGHVGINLPDFRIAFVAVFEVVPGREVVAPDTLEEGDPVRCGVGQHRDMPVACRCRLAATGQQTNIARRADRRLEAQAAEVLGHREGHHRLEHRHFHQLTLPGALAMQQCGQDRVGQRQSAGLVGQQRRRIVGLAGFIADQARNPAGRLDHIVEGRLAGIRP